MATSGPGASSLSPSSASSPRVGWFFFPRRRRLQALRVRAKTQLLSDDLPSNCARFAATFIRVSCSTSSASAVPRQAARLNRWIIGESSVSRASMAPRSPERARSINASMGLL